jgi:heme A synthase
MMMVHLVNTFLLLGNLTLTAVWATWGSPERFHLPARWEWLLPLSLVGILVLGASGAITALGDTLFPAASLAEGMRAEFSGSAHFLLRLRVFHPLIAVLAGVLVYLAARNALNRVKKPAVQRAAGLVIGLFGLQLLLGGINVVLLAPVWMQLIHLLVSNLIWIVQVALTSFVIGRSNGAAGIADHPIHERVPGSAE